ncbi:MAG: DNA polymerase III subunit epsilon [Pedobacter sp.]|nr:MAG: DNA polymerase III subunit epsilon [Pedobacter sp.]
MLYAIVDIETTGGHPSANCITEVAINLHDGEKIIERYCTLIKPRRHIPLHITALTGIDDAMVEQAPYFEAVADRIAELLEGKIFIAHNVNFDYSFLKHHLSIAGYELNCRKLCTVRMSRKVIPGHSSYSLGKLCNSLNIPIVDRHRASGDADATTILFELLLSKDDQLIAEMIKKTSKEQLLPPNLPVDSITSLPAAPGVYYFKDNKGKVIYVGKAINIKKRVIGHFTGHKAGKQRQDFLKNVYKIDHIQCGTELMALILEASEIRRLWPENNRALKRYEHKYGLFLFEDQNGYKRLAIDKQNNAGISLQSFNNMLDGYNYLNRIVEQYNLCPKLCYLQRPAGKCTSADSGNCNGACAGDESTIDYNERLLNSIESIQNDLPSFALIDKGRENGEYSCLLVENGKFYGMGYVSGDDQTAHDRESLKETLQPYPSNNYILNLVLNHASRYPEKLCRLNG